MIRREPFAAALSRHYDLCDTRVLFLDAVERHLAKQGLTLFYSEEFHQYVAVNRAVRPTRFAPMPSCITPDRPARSEPISAADWLSEVLRAIGLDGG